MARNLICTAGAEIDGNPETQAQEFKQFRVEHKWTNNAHLERYWFIFRKKMVL